MIVHLPEANPDSMRGWAAKRLRILLCMEMHVLGLRASSADRISDKPA
jgi:hypothetical protein